MILLKKLLIFFILILIPFSASGFDLEGAQALSESELDGMRGGYTGYFFTITFKGFWDTLGNMSATLDSSGNVTQGASSSSGSGDAVNAQASVGENAFGNSRGIFLITQVPGNQNFVQAAIVIDLTILNIFDSSVQPGTYQYSLGF
jgi:hypothetical protein